MTISDKCCSLEKQYSVLQSEGGKLRMRVRHFLETESFSLHRMFSNQKQNSLKLSAISLKLCFYVVLSEKIPQIESCPHLQSWIFYKEKSVIGLSVLKKNSFNC